MNIDFNTVLNTLAAKAKALALNVTEIELKVLEATNEEPWGPHGKAMQEIARAAEEPEKYNLIMNVISERLQMRDENWRLCYKALLLLEYMVKHGPWRIVEELNRSVSSLERLRDDFEYKDQQGRDQGINVRQRAGELAALVCNYDRVRQEREKAARNASKFKGVSSSDVRGGFGGFGSTSYGSSGGGGYGYGGFGGGGGYGNGGLGGRAQGFGSTESVHVPSSQHNRNGSGSSHYTAPGLASGGPSGRRDEAVRVGGEEAEDPFEATRKRIERLKAEGALQDSAPTGPPPGLVDPAAANAKAPKKLSDVKINPAVAATFANISLPTSSSTGNLAKLVPPPPPGQPVKPALTAQPSRTSNSIDLFADTPSASQPANQQQQQQQQSSSGLDWDAAFGAGTPAGGSAAAVVAATAAPADPFADFAAAAVPAAAPTATTAAVPVAAPTAAPSGFEVFFGGADGGVAPPASSNAGGSSAAAAASAKPPVRAPLPFDAFSELGDPSPAPHAPVAVGLSASSTAPSAAPATDPFAALATSSSAVLSVSAPSMAASRPAPAAAAAAADPFAALSVPPQAAAAPAPVAISTVPALAPIPFDAFGTAAPSQPVRTLQPATAAAVSVADPFAALASGSAAAPVPMAAAARAAPQPAVAAATAFDPFVSAPAPAAAVRPAAAVSTFDAFGSMAAAPPPPPAAAVSDGFDDFFGPSSSGHNGNFVGASKPATVAAVSTTADPFTASSFTAFPPPPPPASLSATASPAAASNSALIAMNKLGAAHGAAGHKNHDPFAGLGF